MHESFYTKETKKTKIFVVRPRFFCLQFFYCIGVLKSYVIPFVSHTMERDLNSELTKKALEKVGNPNVLVNLVSRRVRQLSSGGGAASRPLVAGTANLGAGDIALREIIEDKIGFEMPEIVELTRPVGKKRKKH
jgi:DNA-directed RNA polymerase subunit omega